MGGASVCFASAALLFSVFTANVLMGAARLPAFLNDVAEMLMLFGACIVFVIAVLLLERKKNASSQPLSNEGGAPK